MENGESKALALKEVNLPMKANDPSAILFNKDLANHLYEMARTFSKSALLPGHFRGKPADCFVALQLAARLGVDPWALMQSTYIVHGKPGFEAKFASGLVNQSGLIIGRMKYRTRGGDDPERETYAVQAYATDTETREEVTGSWITWKMVKAEGWNQDTHRKDGGIQSSKWNTMAEQMFHYRAAMFFVRRHYPEVLLGMQTTEELHDVGPAEVLGVETSPRQASADELAERLKGKVNGALEKEGPEPLSEDPGPEPPAPLSDDPGPSSRGRKLSEAQNKKLHAMYDRRKMSDDLKKRFLRTMSGAESTADLGTNQASAVIKLLGGLLTAHEVEDWIRFETKGQGDLFPGA